MRTFNQSNKSKKSLKKEAKKKLMAEQDQSEEEEDSAEDSLDPKAALKRKLSQANRSGKKKEKQ